MNEKNRSRSWLKAALIVIGLFFLESHVLAQTTAVGASESQFTVESGVAKYSVKIKVAPGTAGMQPELTLSYNDTGNDGNLGQSWGIGGLSSITRGGANKSNNDVPDPIDFDGNDKFYLDGQLLVAIKGTYGANLTEYRTESESFNKVISYGVAGSGPAYFVTWEKSGRILTYGNTTNSRIEAPGTASVVVWAVNQIQDRSGNYMLYNVSVVPSTA
jgi:hypothetical protein